MGASRKLLQLRTTLAYARGGYSVEMAAGSEGTVVNVLLDTGSSTLALTARNYAPARDAALAATALAQQVTYGKGAWAGPVLRSSMAFGHGEHARELSDAAFAFVENDASSFFRDADGILGLAYRHLNRAHDMSAQLQADGHTPALTWPWPYPLNDEAQFQAFKQQLRQQPGVTVEPFFSALEEHGVVADTFALLVRRAVVHVLDDSASSGQLAGDPLNQGVLVVGGGEECQSLYHGAFADVRIVHDVYYNANLISVQVGDQEPIPAPALSPQYVASYASNAFIDTGSSFVMLEASIYDAVLDGLARHDARLPGLIAQFQERFVNERGLPNADIDERDWPVLCFRLESSDGGEVSLSCDPSDYWQRNGLVAGESLFLLLRQIDGWANQSILGLPLPCGRYCVFDRSDQGCGRVRIAAARTDGQ